jgi:hypothetical protein
MADFWGRMFFTAVVVFLLGLAIFGASTSEEAPVKSEAGEFVGGFLAFMGAISAIVSILGFIWTAN